MRHSYKKMVVYDPGNREVRACRLIKAEHLFNDRMYEAAFWDLYNGMDRTTCTVIGVTITGDTYQLSPAPYKKYIKEDAASMQFIDHGELVSAMLKYQTKHKLWSKDYD